MGYRPVIRPAIGTLALLLVPVVFTIVDRDLPAGEGWRWGVMDFVVMATLLFSAGVAWELLARRLAGRWQRVALGVAVLGVVLAVWVELAVGGISQWLHYPAG